MTDIDRNEPKALKDSALEDVTGGYTTEDHKYAAREYKLGGITLTKNANAPDTFLYKGKPISEKDADAIIDKLAQRTLK